MQIGESETDAVILRVDKKKGENDHDFILLLASRLRCCAGVYCSLLT